MALKRILEKVPTQNPVHLLRCFFSEASTAGSNLKEVNSTPTGLAEKKPSETQVITEKPISMYQSQSLPLSVKNLNALSNRAAGCNLESTLQLSTGISFRRKLFTPGPMMVSDRVKTAMMVDFEATHADFTYVIKYVRNALLHIAKADPAVFSAILLNGSGTFAIEATLKTLFQGKDKELLVLENGKCAQRIADLCRSSGFDVEVIPLNMKALNDALMTPFNRIVGVISVHCETSTGMINPVDNIAAAVKKCKPDCLVLVDAMASFGAVPIQMKNVDFVISNPSKCLQGIPGASFIIARRDMLQKHRGNRVGLVLDIGAQYDELEKKDLFLHTPPTHVMLGCKECLMEYFSEGGLESRAARYRKNMLMLKEEMSKMGFKQLFQDDENPDGYIVTSFHYPNVPQFIFEEFVKRLSDAGHVIASDENTVPNCFRIGCIGNLNEDDVRSLTNSIREVCTCMRIEVPLQEMEF